MNLTQYIRDIPDFPQKGILFRDITPLLAAPAAFSFAIEQLVEKAREVRAQAVVAIESRGFMFGVPVALALGIPFVPVRKPGKLPGKSHAVEYALEYGSGKLEMHHDALAPGVRAIVIDDLLATGGTAAAAGQLIAKSGATVAAFLFVIELASLQGRSKLAAAPVTSLLSY